MTYDNHVYWNLTGWFTNFIHTGGLTDQLSPGNLFSFTVTDDIK